MARLTKQRLAVIGELEKAGGAIRSKEGRAVAMLHHKLGRDASTKALAGALASMEEHGLIEREIRGKRTFTIRLVPKGRVYRNGEQAGSPRPDDDGGELPVRTQGQALLHADSDEGSREGDGHELRVPDAGPDYRLLADALLTRVAEVLDSETSTRDLQHRLADLLASNERHRRQLTDVGDELRVVRAERDGLRGRLRQAESNIQAMLDTRNKVGMGDRQRRALERFMQARPTGRG